MKTVVVYGSEPKGSTYHIVQLVKKELHIEADALTEFFLPRDMPHFCIGCTNCFAKSEALCPHQASVTPIKQALLDADLLIFSSPVYVLRATGQMKALLDHFAFWFMLHRPDARMFSKTALIVTTAAGGGMKSTIKDIKTSLTFWGVGSIFSYGKAVYASRWEGVSDKKKAEVERAVNRLSLKILSSLSRRTCSTKVKALFYGIRLMLKKLHINPVDTAYWEAQGWMAKKRPWQKPA